MKTSQSVLLVEQVKGGAELRSELSIEHYVHMPLLHRLLAVNQNRTVHALKQHTQTSSLKNKLYLSFHPPATTLTSLSSTVS